MKRSSICVGAWIRHMKVAVLRLIKRIIEFAHESSSKFFLSAKSARRRIFMCKRGPYYRNRNWDAKERKSRNVCWRIRITKLAGTTSFVQTCSRKMLSSWPTRTELGVLCFLPKTPRWSIKLLAKNQKTRERRLFLCNVKMQLQSYVATRKWQKATRFHLFKCFIWPLSQCLLRC